MTSRLKIFGLTLTSALALGAASSQAADIYQGGSLKDAPVAYAPAPSTWSGFYVGVNLGAGFDDEGDYEFEDVGELDDPFDDGDDEEEAEFIGGVQVGYNIQRYGSPLVLGIEGDLSFAEDIDYLASIRGRIGYGTDSTLLYLTGGVAFADFSDNDFDEFFDNDDDETQTGYVLGGGAEFKLAGNWSLGLEGLYYNFDDKDDDFVDEFGDFHSFEDEQDFWTVRAKLNYHFNRGQSAIDGYK